MVDSELRRRHKGRFLRSLPGGEGSFRAAEAQCEATVRHRSSHPDANVEVPRVPDKQSPLGHITPIPARDDGERLAAVQMIRIGK